MIDAPDWLRFEPCWLFDSHRLDLLLDELIGMSLVSSVGLSRRTNTKPSLLFSYVWQGRGNTERFLFRMSAGHRSALKDALFLPEGSSCALGDIWSPLRSCVTEGQVPKH